MSSMSVVFGSRLGNRPVAGTVAAEGVKQRCRHRDVPIVPVQVDVTWQDLPSRETKCKSETVLSKTTRYFNTRHTTLLQHTATLQTPSKPHACAPHRRASHVRHLKRTSELGGERGSGHVLFSQSPARAVEVTFHLKRSLLTRSLKWQTEEQHGQVRHADSDLE